MKKKNIVLFVSVAVFTLIVGGVLGYLIAKGGGEPAGSNTPITTD